MSIAKVLAEREPAIPERPLHLTVIGHSHIAAVMKGYKNLRSSAPGTPVRLSFIPLVNPEYRPPLKQGKFCPAILRALENSNPQAVLSAIGGNEHTILGLLRHPVPFDFVLPEEPETPLDESASIVPSGIVRAWLRESLDAGTLRIIAALRAAVPIPILHLESPPPVPSADFIAQVPDSKFSDRIAEMGVAPAALRYKLWRLHAALVREFCADLGIEYIPVPEEMQDQDGMLVERAWGNATHANEIFGRALLEMAVARLQTSFKNT